MDTAVEFIKYIITIISENFIMTILFTVLILFSVAYLSENEVKGTLRNIYLKLKTN